MNIIEKKEQKRQKILEIAFAIFKEKGRPDITIRELAKAANVQAPVIYQLFSGKEELTFRIIELIGTEICNMLLENMHYEHPFLNLTQYGLNYIKYARTNPLLFSYVFENNFFVETISTSSISHSLTQKFISTSQQKMLTILRDIIKEIYALGISVYEDKKVSACDIDLLVMKSWATVHGLASLVIMRHLLKNYFSDFNSCILDTLINQHIMSQDFIKGRGKISLQAYDMIKNFDLDI